MHVELDIFSGRPNPEWSLTAEQAAQLRGLFESLPIADAPPPRFDGLGYRGIVVTDPTNPGWTLVAFRETVRLLTARATEARADPERHLERWLLESSGGVIDQTLRARIGN